VNKSITIDYELGNDRIDIFYRVANPSIWMYYLPDQGMKRTHITCVHAKN